MKRSWLNRKPGYKGLKRSGSRLARKKRLSTSRTVRRDQGQREPPPPLARCDSLLSTEVRRHGSWICVRCRRDFSSRRQLLGASHFFNKDEYTAVRYDPRNVDPLCHECHTGRDGWEYQKAGEYMRYMFKKLGPDGYEALRALAMSRVKSEDARLQFIERLRGGTLWTQS